MRDEAPTIFGDGETSRDFTHIDNVVHANLSACVADDKCAGEVMNIACGERVTLNELSDLIREHVGRGKPAVHEPERVGDVKHSLASIDRAKALIGYEPLVSFSEGIERVVEWYMENAE